MTWHAQLDIDYTLESGRTVARHVHTGPLRVLQSLYPDGDAICQNVLVHPPGGLVGGDTLDITVRAQSGAHGVITTPGATRFYRSEGEMASQRTHLHLAAHARLQWLPQETICYSACRAENRLTLSVEPGAELIGWDVCALGLPHAHQPFVQGSMQTHLELPGVWLERCTLDAQDHRLLDGPCGLAGNRCMALVFLVTGNAMDRNRRQLALDSARTAIAGSALAGTAGVTSPNPQVIVARCIAEQVEPAMQLARAVRGQWLEQIWALPATTPRIWSM